MYAVLAISFVLLVQRVIAEGPSGADEGHSAPAGSAA
jgi:hypothetical protein